MLAFVKADDANALAIAVASWTAVGTSFLAKLTPHMTGVPKN